MSEYIFPTLIFITSLFVLWAIIRPAQKITGIICLVGAGLLSYIVSEIVKTSQENAWIIYTVILILEAILLVIVVFSNKQNLNVKALSIFYPTVMVIAFLIARGCYRDDLRIKERSIAKNQEIENYKKQYDFDVETLSASIDQAKAETGRTQILKSPIIVYRKYNGKTEFYYDFNKSLERNLISYSFDSIKTIIVIENSFTTVGTYSNGTTSAQKIQTSISFIDKKSMTEVASRTLTGSDPPPQISYNHSAPSTRSGSAPSENEIIQTIKNTIGSRN